MQNYIPSFHEQHIEASHRVLVVSYNETNGIPPPFLIWTKKVVRDYFFRLIARLYFFRCACIFYREKNSYSILHTISNLWQFYIAMSNTSLSFFFTPCSLTKKINFFFSKLLRGTKLVKLFFVMAWIKSRRFE